MSRTTRERLADIEFNAAFVRDVIKHRKLKHFTNDVVFRYAVQYALVILAEAISHLPRDLRTKHAEAPWATFEEHGARMTYNERATVDPEVLWQVLTTQLVPLHTTVQNILADTE